MNQTRADLADEVEGLDANYWIIRIAILSSNVLRALALCRASVSRGKITSDNLGRELVDGKEP